jgi:hypothetical protein
MPELGSPDRMAIFPDFPDEAISVAPAFSGGLFQCP